MNVLRVKDGVTFLKIAPGGFRILSAIDQTAEDFGVDLVITSGTDGEHSGPDDPHHRGEAYDIRSQELEEDVKERLLDHLMGFLGWDRFYGFLEAAGSPNEHFHVQVKKGTTYPPV